jgi:hypothetical protein
MRRIHGTAKFGVDTTVSIPNTMYHHGTWHIWSVCSQNVPSFPAMHVSIQLLSSRRPGQRTGTHPVATWTWVKRADIPLLPSVHVPAFQYVCSAGLSVCSADLCQGLGLSVMMQQARPKLTAFFLSPLLTLTNCTTPKTSSRSSVVPAASPEMGSKLFCDLQLIFTNSVTASASSVTSKADGLKGLKTPGGLYSHNDVFPIPDDLPGVPPELHTFKPSSSTKFDAGQLHQLSEMVDIAARLPGVGDDFLENIVKLTPEEAEDVVMFKLLDIVSDMEPLQGPIRLAPEDENTMIKVTLLFQ